MRINYKKTKLLVFNPCWTLDFMPEFDFGADQLELAEELRLFGVIVRSDMKWNSNTDDIVKHFFRVMVIDSKSSDIYR